MKSIDIRKKFLAFFAKHDHTPVKSSSLIPAQDPTLLFTNAGMNQFKDVFLGKEKRSYSRAVSLQKCVRAGGKHNDLDNVGFTRRHLTFFEMMGNFSFGDYFKKEAIQYAWDFLIQEMNLPADKLYATVFTEDDEAYDLWHTMIGLPKSRIYRLGAEDNFWQMGETGPCGPCSEILMDLGEKFGCGEKACAPGCSCDRYFEIWNLVFMQLDRQPDGSDIPLKKTGIDTGMGFERLALAVQGVDSVFETDIFTPLIKKIESVTSISYKDQDQKGKAAFHVLADHCRSSAFLIADGGSPSHEGRGYVIRKIIRRAALFSQKLGTPMILPDLVDPLCSMFNSIYPELSKNKCKIKAILTDEIKKFSQNLVRGQGILKGFFKKIGKKLITGKEAFKLYDTYGFPLELTRIIANEHGFEVDIANFEKEMEQQRIRSGKKMKEVQETVDLNGMTTEFTGYETFKTASTIQGFVQEGRVAQKLSAGQQGWTIPKESPFYVEGGGQVGDQGTVTINGTTILVLQLRSFNGALGIFITAPSNIAVGDIIEQEVNNTLRLDTMKNHTATHLLHTALLKVLGKEIKQSGSFVHPDYLRFDFTYHKQLTPDEIREIETIVNKSIMENIPVSTTWTTYEDATGRGVIAFFGDKYNPERVRVVDVPGVSAELCGGTHVRATGEIGLCKITEVSALSAGTRRIVAVTGPKAIALCQDNFATIRNLCQLFKVKPENIFISISKQQERIKVATTEIRQLRQQLIACNIDTWLTELEEINGIPMLIKELPGYAMDDLKTIATKLQTKRPGFYLLVCPNNGKTSFFCLGCTGYKPKNRF